MKLTEKDLLRIYVGGVEGTLAWVIKMVREKPTWTSQEIEEALSQLEVGEELVAMMSGCLSVAGPVKQETLN